MTLEPTQFATETQLWNAIARQFGQPLPLPAGQVVLTEAEAPTSGARFALALRPGAGLTLVLEDFPFARLAGVEITLDEIQRLPAPLSEGLLLAAVEALRTALPAPLAAAVDLPSQSGDSTLHETWLAAQIDIGQGAIALCRIGGRRQDFVQVLSRLFPDAAGRAAKLPAPLLDGLSVPVALAAGEATLPLATLRALAVGDVILAPIRPDRRSFVIGDRRVEIGTDLSDEGNPTPDAGWTVKEIRMTDEDQTPEPASLGLGDVPMTLRFVTEDQRIALSDLQGLAAGAVLPLSALPLSVGLSLRIQANGVTIGEGQLVQIDDRYAVRIARIAATGT